MGFSELSGLPGFMEKGSKMVAVRFAVSPFVVIGSTEIAKDLAIRTTAVECVIVAFGIEVWHWVWN
jgi:hypothetical protein